MLESRQSVHRYGGKLGKEFPEVIFGLWLWLLALRLPSSPSPPLVSARSFAPELRLKEPFIAFFESVAACRAAAAPSLLQSSFSSSKEMNKISARVRTARVP